MREGGECPGGWRPRSIPWNGERFLLAWNSTRRAGLFVTLQLKTSFVQLIPVAHCRAEQGAFVELDGRELAVFYFAVPQRVIVIDNACPHAGGNLSGGEVRDGVVTCPRHQWQFELSSGVCTRSPLGRVRRYPARIEDGWVWVDFGGADD